MEMSRAMELLECQKNRVISDAAFLKQFGNEQVFYSTPFGDHKDGSKRLFLLPGPDRTGYLPVFTSTETLTAFYEQLGRVNNVIMNGPFISVLETTAGVNVKAPVKMGICIEPAQYGVTVDAGALNGVINYIKS